MGPTKRHVGVYYTDFETSLVVIVDKVLYSRNLKRKVSKSEICAYISEAIVSDRIDFIPAIMSSDEPTGYFTCSEYDHTNLDKSSLFITSEVTKCTQQKSSEFDNSKITLTLTDYS